MEFEGRKGCQGGLSKVTHEQRFDVRTCFEEAGSSFSAEGTTEAKALTRHEPGMCARQPQCEGRLGGD